MFKLCFKNCSKKLILSNKVESTTYFLKKDYKGNLQQYIYTFLLQTSVALRVLAALVED